MSRCRLSEIQKRSESKNIPYNLTTEWYNKAQLKTHCNRTGLKFKKYTNGKRHPFSPSIDRRIPEKGYVQDNCEMVVTIFNQAKADFTEEEVNTWLKAFVEVYEEEYPDEIVLG